MKVRVYTIEWREQIGDKSHKRIAAFEKPLDNSNLLWYN